MGDGVTATGVYQHREVVLDERNQAVLAEGVAALAAKEQDGPQVGEWVVFADGTARRVSYLWPGEPHERTIQTSNPGAGFSIGKYGASMGNGSLYAPIPADTLSLTGQRRDAAVWFPHHGWLDRDCSVTVLVPFRVWSCTEAAPPA